MHFKTEDYSHEAAAAPAAAALKPVVTQDLNQDLLVEAKDATVFEHQMTPGQAFKIYPKAVAWSILFSTAIIMEGYDTLLLGSFYGFPAFVRKFGTLQPDGSYQVSAPWQAGLSNGCQVGEIFGLFFAGYASERFGYRKTMISALVAISAFVFIQFFAPNVQTLQAGYILCGLAWGVFQTITTAYAAEVCPIALRGYLTTYVNLCWVIGQLIASGILRGLLSIQNEWGYRICYAIQWFWPIPIITGVIFAPESPWWLVRCGRAEDATHVIERLTKKGSDTNFNAERAVAMMIHTNDMEKKVSEGTSYFDCLKHTDLRRTEIASVVWLTQAFCGSALMGYSTYFYEQAGLPTTQAFNFSVIQFSLGAIGTMISWLAMTYFGRRTLYLAGLGSMFTLLIVVGIIAVTPAANGGGQWAIGSMLLIFTFVYDCTVGPVCYSLVAEIPATRLRSKTIVIARNVYNVGCIVNNIITPYMLNPTAWNWKAKTGFFWAGINSLFIVWTYFRLPEPKGLAYSELDILFERRVSARNFRSTPVDPFNGVTSELETAKAATEMVEDVQHVKA
ncbi:general substrate transporter [Lipomyces kononenkoae]|uniref:General substrate transporter n=1 Tax=Lipomyces kononenkoae TaxID=34357 RepID=A0ACC3T7Y0_LIPKO